MGYRSTVAISMSNEALDELRRMANEENELRGLKFPLIGKNVDGEEFDFDEVLEENNGIIALFEAVKWYDTYDSIKLFTQLLDELEKAGYAYFFVRLGEDYSDIEYRYSKDAYEEDIPHIRPSTDWILC